MAGQHRVVIVPGTSDWAVTLSGEEETGAARVVTVAPLLYACTRCHVPLGTHNAVDADGWADEHSSGDEDSIEVECLHELAVGAHVKKTMLSASGRHKK